MSDLKLFLLTFVFIVINAQFNRSQAQTVISDGTFDPADWSVVVDSSTGGTSQTSRQELTGGNPFTFRLMEHILPSPPSPTEVGFIGVTHIFEAASYDPALSGAIDHIDFSEDAALLNLPHDNAYLRSRAVIVQDGIIYHSTRPYVIVGSTEWFEQAVSDHQPGDFVAVDGSGRTPDFSASGAPMKFGYRRDHSRVGDLPVPYSENLIYVHAIDEFFVRVYSIGVVDCRLTPEIASRQAGEDFSVHVTVTFSGSNTPVAGQIVTFTVVSGPNADVEPETGPTSAGGQRGFSYTGDGGLGVDIITVTGEYEGEPFTCTAQVTWTSSAHAPNAHDDLFVVEPDESSSLDVLKNDYDPDEDDLEITAVTQPATGAISYSGSGITYTPGTETAEGFKYTVSDGFYSDEAEVTVLIDCGCGLTACLETSTIQSAHQDTVDLDLIRRFRDEILKPSKVGSTYVDIYYNSTPEIAKIVILDRPDIASQAVRMVETMQPVLRNLLDGDGSAVFTQALIDTIGSFFAGLSAAGSDSLQQLIADELARVGPLDNYVGLAVKDVISMAIGDSVATAIRDDSHTVPADFILEQNFPNPFNPSTQITYSLPEAAHVQLTIFNIQGQRIRTLVNNFQTAGTKSVVWNGLDDQGLEMTSGVYFFRLNAGNEFQKTKKMVFMK